MTTDEAIAEVKDRYTTDAIRVLWMERDEELENMLRRIGAMTRPWADENAQRWTGYEMVMGIVRV